MDSTDADLLVFKALVSRCVAQNLAPAQNNSTDLADISATFCNSEFVRTFDVRYGLGAYLFLKHILGSPVIFNVKGSHLNLHGLVFWHCKSSVSGGNTPASKGFMLQKLQRQRGKNIGSAALFAAETFIFSCRRFCSIRAYWGCAFPLTV